MDSLVQILSEHHTNFLENEMKSQVFQTESVIIYKEQIPTAAYLLLDANIKLVSPIEAPIIFNQRGCLIGFWQIYHNHPSPIDIYLQAASRVLILSKSTIPFIYKNVLNQELSLSNI